jgi:hypothetical protein
VRIGVNGAVGLRSDDAEPFGDDHHCRWPLRYIGYQASRFRTRTINVGVIPSIEAQAVTYCQENPDWSVPRAFAQAYLRTRS